MVRISRWFRHHYVTLVLVVEDCVPPGISYRKTERQIRLAGIDVSQLVKVTIRSLQLCPTQPGDDIVFPRQCNFKHDKHSDYLCSGCGRWEVMIY